ncbi:GCN5 family acetyltransferase [Endozoicomonas numazuensis]|uniref:GCN5 family acetyltransferase n=1 Tax=Endozoicomonas numazuensis TaxID=1137799 RepID=A0A081NF85_9GAMM|nr:GCN5 family acetyltransferase [Endozoicomonas numazuensis]
MEADPSEECIQKYLKDSWCYAALEDDTVIGICVVKPENNKLAELFNIAVSPDCQAKGTGSKLLKFTLDSLKNKGVQRVELGTGTFGYQLAFYQRQGFRVDSIRKNFFLDHYVEPIFEQGIQHKDMLRLVCDLTVE